MKLFKFSLILAALAVPLGATAAERLYLEVPIQFAPNMPIVSRVKTECDIERHMNDDAEAGITKRYGPVELAAKSDAIGNDKALRVTILTVDGIGGGGWTGPKSMTVLAELKQGDKLLSSKIFTRASRGSMFSGTCDALQKVTQTLGSDIGIWLTRGAVSEGAEASGKVLKSAD